MEAAKTPILFLGTPQFAATALEGLVEAGFNIVGVVCRPDEKSGRGGQIMAPATKIMAEKYGIPVYQPKNKTEITESVIKLQPELLVVAAYGMIVPQEVLDTPKYGALNIHGSLLPKYRGASPITEAILNGDSETGVTIMQMTLGMDEGPIVSCFKLPIADEDTTETLTEKMAQLGAKAIVETIPDWVSGELKATPQNEEQATYCRKITKEDGHIDWNQPAEQIERMIRAYQPWPTAFTFANNVRIKIFEAKVVDIKQPIGTINFNNNAIYIGTSHNSLEITILQPEGKTVLNTKAFINGYKQFDSIKLT